MKNFVSTLAALIIGATAVGAVTHAQGNHPDDMIPSGISVLGESVRVIDTREGDTLSPIPLPERPFWAAAAFVNVVVTNTSSPGYVTLYDCGRMPPTSNLNWDAINATESGLAIAPISPMGEICVHASTDVDVIVDLVAWAEATYHYTLP